MTIETILLLLRHVLTAAGSLLVARGLAASDVTQATDATLTAAGGLLTLGGLVWSWWRKYKRAQTSPGGGTLVSLFLLSAFSFLLSSTGCTLVSTTTSRKRALPDPIAIVGSNSAKPSAAADRANIIEEEVRTRAYSLFDSAQKIERAQAHQSSTSQTAGFSGLDQSASTSNFFTSLQVLGQIMGNAYTGHATPAAAPAPQTIFVTNYVTLPAPAAAVK